MFEPFQMISGLSFELRGSVHPPRNVSKNFESGMLAAMDVDCCTDHGIKQDHKGRSECRDEKECLSFVWSLPGTVVACRSNAVQHEKSRQP